MPACCSINKYMRELGFTDMAVSKAAVVPAEHQPGGLGVQYRIRLRLFPAAALQQSAQLSFAQVAAAFEKAFVALFQVWPLSA